MPYRILSAGELTVGRVDDLAATLWGPSYQFLLVAIWTGRNTVLRLYDLTEGAVFQEQQLPDPAQRGNDLVLAAPAEDRALLGFKRTPGGKISYLARVQGVPAADAFTETTYLDHDLQLVALPVPSHPHFIGGTLAAGSLTVGRLRASEAQEAIHAAAVSISSTHKMRLAIWRFNGGGDIPAKLHCALKDVSEPASRARVVSTAEYLDDGMLIGADLVTAVRHNHQLKLIRWRYDRRHSPDRLTRIGDTVLTEQVDDCVLTTIRTNTGVALVTAMRLVGGPLRVVGWKLGADGSIARWLERTAEGVASVSCAWVRGSELVTAVKLQSNGNLRLIYWGFPISGSPSGLLERLAQQDGDAVGWVKCLHQPGVSESHPGHTITLCRLPNGKLQLRRWRAQNA